MPGAASDEISRPRLRNDGAKVVLAGRTRENLEATLRLLPAVSQADALVAPTDVSKPEDVDSLHHTTEQRFGRADILINSAGIFGPLRPLTLSDPDEWIQTLSINCVGPYLTCRAFAPGMVDRGWGRIVNVSSAAPLYPPAAVNSAYGTSKAALNQMTRHLAAELAGTGVTANVMHPGSLKTEMWADMKTSDRGGRSRRRGPCRMDRDGRADRRRLHRPCNRARARAPGRRGCRDERPLLLAGGNRRRAVAVLVSAARWPLKVAVVGLGGWGIEHARAWSSLPGVELVAVCDHDESRLRDVARDFAGAAEYVSAEALAREIDLDVVSIATHEADRLAVTLPFLERGVHALVEKPMALTVEEATKLRDAGAAHGVYVMPGHVLRFDARLMAVKEELDRGSLGEVRSVYARRLIPRSRHGKYARAHPALVAAIHDYDLVRWFIGAEPRSVTSHALPRGGESVPDILWSTFEFAGEHLAVVENAWVIPEEAGVWLEAEIEVIGTEGIARVHIPGDLSLWLSSGHALPDTTLVPFVLGTSMGALRDELSYLATCIARQTRPERVTPDDGIEAVRLAQAAAESGARGMPVVL